MNEVAATPVLEKAEIDRDPLIPKPEREISPLRVRHIWGLTPPELHDRFWAARGVQVIRQGERWAIDPKAELYLLSEPGVLALFRLRPIVDKLSWLRPELFYVNLHDGRVSTFREKVKTDHSNRFVQFERFYKRDTIDRAGVVLCVDPSIAKVWQQASTPHEAFEAIERHTSEDERVSETINGSIFGANRSDDINVFLEELVSSWKEPSATISGLRHVESNVWASADAKVDPSVEFVGAAWIGAGRKLIAGETVIGPAVVWDHESAVTKQSFISHGEIEPSKVFSPQQVKPTSKRSYFALKRLFDVVVASLAIVLLLPVFPIIMLLILLEDGWPVFFFHRRETLKGREFPCFKFRTMRRDADEIKKKLIEQNKADGPQFFMDKDPRITRIGHFLRKTNLDELPQLFNVLLGHMSIVGPRPSPHNENQYCPQWREARLSVRPGLTGLWQIKRSRAPGLDFQEWIEYDIEYVERVSFRLDLWIIYKTIPIVLRGFRRR